MKEGLQVRSEQQELEVTDAEIVIWVKTDRRFSGEELARAQAAAQVALTGSTHDTRPPVFVNYYPPHSSGDE